MITQNNFDRQKRGTIRTHLRTDYAFLFTIIRYQLNENHFCVDDFDCSVSNVVAPFDPFHWVYCFEFFGHIFFVLQCRWIKLSPAIQRLQDNCSAFLRWENCSSARSDVLLSANGVAVPICHKNLVLFCDFKIRQVIVAQLMIFTVHFFVFCHCPCLRFFCVNHFEFFDFVTCEFDQQLINCIGILPVAISLFRKLFRLSMMSRHSVVSSAR